MARYTPPIPLPPGEAPTLLTIAQGINTIGRKLETMANELQDLDQAVTKELADDQVREQKIAELEATITELETQLATAQEAAQGGEEAKAGLQEALAAAVAATERLKSNDLIPVPPAEETPVEEPPADGTPVEPVPGEPV